MVNQVHVECRSNFKQVFILQKHLLVLIGLVAASHQEAPFSSYAPPPTSYLPPSSGCPACTYQQPIQTLGPNQIDFPPQITKQYISPLTSYYKQPYRYQPPTSYGAPNVNIPVDYIRSGQQTVSTSYTVPNRVQTIVQPLPSYTAPGNVQTILQPLPTYTSPGRVQTVLQPLPTYTAPGRVQTVVQPLPAYTAPSRVHTITQPLPTYTAPGTSIVQPLPTYTAPIQTIGQPNYIAPQQEAIVHSGQSSFNVGGGYDYSRPQRAFV